MEEGRESFTPICPHAMYLKCIWMNICNSQGNNFSKVAMLLLLLLVVVVMGDGASAGVVFSCGNVSVMVLILHCTRMIGP